MAPCRVSVGEAQDQGGELFGDRRPSDARRFLLPLPVKQAAMPGEQGSGGDQAVPAQVGWQVPGEGCEHGAVWPGETRPCAELAAQHRVLVTQREQLDVLGVLRAGEQQEQSEEPQEDQIEHAQRHAVRDCHDRPELQSA
jgi:hypothetical protein